MKQFDIVHQITVSVLANDLVWGCKAIATEIGRTERQVFWLLESGALPSKKVGGRWCASKSALRRFFVEAAP
ncbi:MAG TPA: hypothetical protein VFE60_14335 [Roseiarcus sp.]|jgi:hypothetical protein|nr:hypothetical protein [Roseiarcus sp.]